MKVMLVDDDPNLRGVLCDILKTKGVESIPAETGAAALTCIEGSEIDVALIDLKLEDMSGLEVLRSIKGGSPDTECILLTGFASQDLAIEAINLGAYSYFQKPYEVEQLLVAIRRAGKRAAGKALRESEERFRGLYENATMGIYRTTPAGYILLANPTLVKMLGYDSFEELATNNLEKNVYAPDYSREQFKTKIEKDGEVRGLESGWTRKDGSIVYVRESAKAIRDPHGEILYYEGTVEDITERVQAEEAQRQSDLLFQALFELSPDAIVLIDPHDPNISWPIVGCNAATCLMNGYRRDELIGHSIDILNATPGTQAERIAYMERLRKTGSLQLETQHRHKSGSMFHVEISTTLIKVGKRELVIGIDRDITERVQAEEEIKKLGRHYQALIEKAPDGIVLLNDQGNFKFISPSAKRMFGFGVSDELTCDPAQYTHPDDLPLVLSELNKLLEDPSYVPMVQHRFTDKKGNWKWVESTFSNLLADPSVESIVINFRDITERKHTEEILRESEQKFRSFVEQSDDAIVLTNERGVIIEWNRGVERIFGRQRAEAIEQFLWDIQFQAFPQEQKTPQAYEQLKTTLLVALNTGQEDWLNQLQEMEIRRSDGINLTIQTMAFPIQAKNGFMLGSISRDITSRKRAEEALHESEERFRIIFERANDAIHIDNADDEILAVKSRMCELMGYSREELLKMHVADLQTPERRKPGNVIKNELALHGSALFEALNLHRDGRRIPVEISIGRIELPSGDLYVSIVRDITERVQAENDLKESKALVEAVVENIPIMLFLKEATDLRFVMFNHAGEELLGYDRKALLGKNNLDLFPPEQASHFMTKDREVLEGEVGLLDIPEEPILTAKKGQRLLHTRKICIRGADGATKYLLGISEDITERVQVEEALRESEAQYRGLFENSVMGISQALPNGRLVRVNTAYSKMYGYSSPEEMMAEVVHIGHQLYANPDDREEVLRILAAKGIMEPREMAVVRRDGTRFYVLVCAREIRDPNGDLLCYQAEHVDITERKRAEDGLRASEERYRLLVDNLPDGVVVHSQGRVVFANPASAAIIGAASPADLTGKSVLEFVHPDYRELASKRIQQSLSGGSAVPISEEKFLRLDGTPVDVEVSGLPFSYAGKPAMLTVFNDITERVQAEQAIHLMSDAQGQIVHLDNLTDIYQLVGEKIQELVGDGYVSISMLDEKIQAMKIVGLYGFGSLYTKLVRKFKMDPSKIVYSLKDMTDDEVRIFRSGKLEKVDGGLYSMLTRKVPKSICHLAEKQLKLTGIYAMGFVGQGIHYGGLTLLAKRDIAPYKDMIETIMNQAAISIKRIRAENETQTHVVELETLYESGLTLNQLLSPKEIGEKIIELLEQKMHWHHTTVRLHHPQDETLELLAFNQPGLKSAKERREAEEHFSKLISRPGDGLSGWVVINSEIVRSGDVSNDPRYVESYPGLRSGLYVPIKSGEHTIGVISIESEKPNAFSEADERLVATLANQAAVAFENARLYQTAQQEIIERKRIENLLAEERNQLASRVQERTADLNRVNTDLARAMRVKDEFLASMSHELRTPLTGILGLSEALQLKAFGELNDKQRQTLKNIEESGRHLLELINDILDLSKIEAGRLELQFAPCSLADICQASLQLIKGMAQHKHQLVHYSPPTEPIIVRADARRLKQLLVNLLSNAVKFTPENGELGLEVQAIESERKFKLIVWDKGIGIKPEDLHKLFEPFVQLDGGLAREYPGTGLGLSLAQHLAELHNGAMEVESVFGEGSRFTVSLPWLLQIATPMPFTPGRGTGGLSSSVISKSHLVMFADDNEMVLGMVADFLEAKQFRVMKARSGAELLERAAEFHPDIMLVDIQMPDMDGLETIRRIRSHADPRVAAAPVIAVTALAMPGDREHCLGAGANGYLSKPLRLIELAEAIQNLLKDKQ